MKRILLTVLMALTTFYASAQNPLAPLPYPVFRAMDQNGKPLSGGKIFSYVAGTTTPLATFTDASGTVPNTNPVILDSTGSARVYLGPSSYKLVLQNQFGVQQWTVDNLLSPGKLLDPSQILGTAVVENPTGSQTVTQPAGSSLNVTNLNNVVSVFGDGTTDNSAAIQTAVNACPSGQSSDCRINLVNTVIAATVTLPINSNITFTATGKVACTTATGIACFKRSQTTAVLVTTQISFYGIKFVQSTGGIVIWDTLIFDSNGNAGETVVGCTFILSNSSVGMQMNGTQRGFIADNYFTSPTSADMTGVAIQPQGTAPGAVNSSMLYTVTGNIFSYLIAFNPQAVDATTSDCWEGWQITGNFFRVAKISVFKGNAINFSGNQMTESDMVIDSSFNEIIQNNYFDTNLIDTSLLTITNTVGNTVSLQIEGNHFEANGRAGTNMIAFTNGGTSHLTEEVNITGNTYTGGSNSATDPIYGVTFGDAALRNVYLAGENFNFLYSCLHLTATLSRSTIGQFEANNPVFYADGFGTFADQFVIAEHLYKVFHVHVSGNVAPSGITSNIASEMLYYPQMFPGEVVTLSQVSGETCSTGASFISSFTATGARYVTLQTNNSAAAGTAFCDLTATIDGTVYVGPR